MIYYMHDTCIRAGVKGGGHRAGGEGERARRQALPADRRLDHRPCGKCAAQLRQVAEAVHLRPAATMPAITLTRAMMGGGPMVPEEDSKSEAQLILSEAMT